ncbi:MAG: cytochrome c oxidase subunit II [Actinomycetota bacterium]
MRRPKALLLPLAVALLALPSCSSRFGAPDPSSQQSVHVLNLWRLFVGASIVVGGIVIGLILFSIVRYRGNKPGQPAAFNKHIPLEIAYTAIPVLIVAGLFYATFGVEQKVDSLSAKPALTVSVTGFDWSWRFAYVGTDVAITGLPDRPPTLVLPEGRVVRFYLHSADVIHSFYVPDLLFKRDVIPGRTNVFQIVPDRLGTFHGQCAEFCGLDHAEMTFSVRVVTGSEFDAWLAQQGTAS